MNIIGYRVKFTNLHSPISIVFLPGGSGHALGKKWDWIEDACTAQGWNFLRVETFTSKEELNKKSIALYQKDLEAFMKFLQPHSTSVVIIGKSLGGAMALLYKNPLVQCVVAWAPPLSIGRSTVERLYNTPFSQMRKSCDIVVRKTYYSSSTVHVCIIHGTKDERIPYKNSQTLVQYIPDATLVLIKEADHSFTKWKEELSKETITFISKTVDSQ